MLLLVAYIVVSTRGRILLGIIQRKKKGATRKMPTQLIEEFMGKMCTVSLFNEAGAITGKIVALEGNWIKVEEKKTTRLVNGDMIRDIKLVPEKPQK